MTKTKTNSMTKTTTNSNHLQKKQQTVWQKQQKYQL